MWAVVGIAMLLLPVWHLVADHSLLRPGRETLHMRRHAVRSRVARQATDVAWYLWMGTAICLIVFL